LKYLLLWLCMRYTNVSLEVGSCSLEKLSRSCFRGMTYFFLGLISITYSPLTIPYPVSYKSVFYFWTISSNTGSGLIKVSVDPGLSNSWCDSWFTKAGLCLDSTTRPDVSRFYCIYRFYSINLSLKYLLKFLISVFISSTLLSVFSSVFLLA
jgi:hypothetical protein